MTPADVLERRSRRHCRRSFRGNEDAFLPAALRSAAATLHIARRQLTDEEVAFLRSLPRGLDLVLDGKQVTLLHATPDDPLYSYLGPDRDRWRAALATIDADLVLVGHTHLPFHYQFGDVQILNPGSLGEPKDGDPRAAYAVIEDGVPRLERASYPVERTIDALRAAAVDPAALGALSALLRTGRSPGGVSSD